MLLDADLYTNRKPNPVLGEDTWELFEAMEASFGVELGDYYGLCGMTVKELTDRICEQGDFPPGDICLSSASFYRLRRAFMEVLDVPRERIRPSTLLHDLVPWRERRTLWRSIEEATGWSMPRLMWPLWLVAIALLGPTALLLSLRVIGGLPIGGVWIGFGSVLLIVPVLWALGRLARTFPVGAKPFGELAELVLARNYAAIARESGSSSEEDVLQAVRRLIAIMTSVKVETISDGTRVPQDLNIY